MRLAIIMVAIMAVLLGCGPSASSEDISQTELLTRMADQSAPIIIDVRTEAEFQQGHIPGAINVPLQGFVALPAALPVASHTELVVYCETGKRALIMKKTLEKQGFFEVRHLQGDMKGWRDEGLARE